MPEVTEKPVNGDAMLDALRLQARACEQLGSPFHAALLRDLAADYEAGGPTRALLQGRSERPVHDATPLRLLGTVHRLVLDGQAPALAEHYPSVGGDGRPPDLATFLDVVAEHRDIVDEGLGHQVQTNEVGRAAALVLGFAEVGRASGLPLRILEVGASAGLNLRWDHFAYDTGSRVVGVPESPVRFAGVWSTEPDLSGLTPVVERAGCDLSPIDLTAPGARTRLLSFVWPDQVERFDRLRAALEVAARAPVAVDQGDAGAWVAQQLAAPRPHLATVVYHSIVWQYLAPDTRDALRAALREAADRATVQAPLAWLRLEPAGPVADLRLTMWPGGDEHVLATSGYHGAPVSAL